MRNIREAALSGIILTGTLLGSSACTNQELQGTPGASFVNAGQKLDSTPTPPAEKLDPGYKKYVSPHGFEMEYPSTMKQTGDTFRGGFPSDFISRVRIITPDQKNGKTHTPPLISSSYSLAALEMSRTQATVSGCETIRTETFFPKSAFGTDVEAVTYSITGSKGEQWTVEFAADRRNFNREFPQGRIEKMMSSFKITR